MVPQISTHFGTSKGCHPTSQWTVSLGTLPLRLSWGQKLFSGDGAGGLVSPKTPLVLTGRFLDSPPCAALWLERPWCLLTLDVPGPPDGIVEADLVSAEQLEAFEILPFGRHQFATVRERGLGQAGGGEGERLEGASAGAGSTLVPSTRHSSMVGHWSNSPKSDPSL